MTRGQWVFYSLCLGHYIGMRSTSMYFHHFYIPQLKSGIHLQLGRARKLELNVFPKDTPPLPLLWFEPRNLRLEGPCVEFCHKLFRKFSCLDFLFLFLCVFFLCFFFAVAVGLGLGSELIASFLRPCIPALICKFRFICSRPNHE